MSAHLTLRGLRQNQRRPEITCAFYSAGSGIIFRNRANFGSRRSVVKVSTIRQESQLDRTDQTRIVSRRGGRKPHCFELRIEKRVGGRVKKCFGGRNPWESFRTNLILLSCRKLNSTAQQGIGQNWDPGKNGYSSVFFRFAYIYIYIYIYIFGPLPQNAKKLEIIYIY